MAINSSAKVTSIFSKQNLETKEDSLDDLIDKDTSQKIYNDDYFETLNDYEAYYQKLIKNYSMLSSSIKSNFIDNDSDLLYNKEKEGDTMSETSDKRVVDMLIEMQKENKQDIKDIEQRTNQNLENYKKESNNLLNTFRQEAKEIFNQYKQEAKEREERFINQSDDYQVKIDKKLSKMETIENHIRYSGYANFLALVALVIGFFYFVLSFIPNLIKLTL